MGGSAKGGGLGNLECRLSERRGTVVVELRLVEGLRPGMAKIHRAYLLARRLLGAVLNSSKHVCFKLVFLVQRGTREKASREYSSMETERFAVV